MCPLADQSRKMPRQHRKQNFRSRNFPPRKPREFKPQDQLQETEVGIEAFVNDNPGFSGIIKARFSDFQVNEIDEDGQLAKLTDQSIPDDFRKKNAPKPNDNSKTPTELVPQSTWDEILSLLEDAEKSVEFDCTTLSKEERTKVHECLKTSFGHKIYGNTSTTDGKRVIVFRKFTGKTSDDRVQWPQDKGEYVHFLLYKECLDTLDACMKLGDCLKMSAANFTYAGVKDKRAKTTQWMSVKRVEPWKLIKNCRRVRNVRVGNITFKDSPMKLGQLTGNMFRVALRNVIGDDDFINKSLENLKENGFVNYYGLQRFGKDKEVPTFSIGVQLLLGNWKQACSIILKPVQSDDPTLDTARAKKIYSDTGNAAEALKEFDNNRNKCIEYFLLSGLSKGHENEFVNALESIPRNTRLLYIHAFQSLIWNMAVSNRLEKFGLKAVPGDLVLIEDLDENLPVDVENNVKVKIVTEDECKNYTIYDILLPLPGYDIIYPENMKDFYKESLEKHGLSLEMPKQKVRTYSLSGTYRKVLGRVKDLSWKIMHYDDPNYNLIRSDLEEIKGEEEPEDVPGGKYKALVLQFSLTSSSYATMVLREILKTDTSNTAHAKLNSYHEEVVNEEVKVEDEKIGLLGDAAKYEAFKDLVFNEGKRKLEEETEEATKKLKPNL